MTRRARDLFEIVVVVVVVVVVASATRRDEDGVGRSVGRSRAPDVRTRPIDRRRRRPSSVASARVTRARARVT